jgi:dihydroorotase
MGCNGIYVESKMDSNILKRVFEYGKMKNQPIFCFCENKELIQNGVINDGNLSAKLGLPSIPKIAETSEVAKIIEIAKDINCKVIFKAISTARGIELIDNFTKGKSEVSINHLLLNEDCCSNFNTYGKIQPPLREKYEKNKLLNLLKNKKIDILTSLHSHTSKTQKDLAFEEASFGIDTISNYFSLIFSLVKNNYISLEYLSEISSFNPAKILGLNKGLIKVGYDSDLIIVDLNKQINIKEKKSPYYGKKLFGKIIYNY